MTGKRCFAFAVTLGLCLGLHATEAAAAPKKINSCTTLTEPGSYVLAQNLIAAGDCLGLSVTCPSNILENTATNNGANLVLAGAGCNSEHNLAP